ncbi:MAG: SDR family oxidoreductase [Elusimicrobia bacterium]|nr:SDR family oxidoreductase [Elusimicrobiota bacterium]
MNILITGASSELGCRLYRQLKSSSRLAGASYILLQHRNPVEAAAGDQVVTGSLGNLPPLPTIQMVLHLAAATHARKPQTYFEINAEGTANLLRALDRTQLKHFIYVSTRCLGRTGGGYSHSKHLAEKWVRRSGVPWTIFRPAEVVGERRGRGITQWITWARHWGIFPVLLTLRRVTLAPVGIEDVAEAIARCALNLQCLKKTYTLAGPRGYTPYELWRSLRKVLPGTWPIPVPLGLVKGICRLNSVWPFFPYVMPDQVGRLTMAKEEDSREAVRDLGFRQRPFEELLHGAR